MVNVAMSVIKCLHRECSSRDRSHGGCSFELQEGLLYMILECQLIQIIVWTEKIYISVFKMK